MSKSNRSKQNKKKEQALTKWLTRREVSPEVCDLNPSDIKGLVKQLMASTQRDLYTTIMVVDNMLTTDGSGVIASAAGDAPSTDANWAAIASVFDEYRTLGTIVKFHPKKYVGSSIYTFAPIVTVIDLDTATNLTGYTLASQYSSCKEHEASQGWTRYMPMSGFENASFISTGSPASKCYVKWYSSGNTASTDLGRLQVYHVVQFRGKGI